jgi:protein-S-isoprenylcysteine O-methyltransferase Ste14
MRAATGTLIFFFVAPCTVAGWLPYWLTHWQHGHGWTWPAGGWTLIALGVLVLAESFVRFVREGLGTPAPPMPTRHLVRGGCYRLVRNPMYAAVLSILAGQAILFGQPCLWLYAGLVWISFRLFVVWYEEPRLRATFGRQYERFVEQVTWRGV